MQSAYENLIFEAFMTMYHSSPCIFITENEFFQTFFLWLDKKK